MTALLVFALLPVLAVSKPLCAQQASGYSFVVIMTDDQRFDTLWAMPNVVGEIASRGVSFTDAIVTTPVCGPSRASILSGGYYAKNTGVLHNKAPNGGAALFAEDDNLGLLLQQAGYRTAFVGKWMNSYVEIAPHVPAGWDKFVSTWGNHEAVEGSSGAVSELGDFVALNQRRITYETEHVLDFLDSVDNRPFFVELSVFNPHSPPNNAGQFRNRFVDYTYRGRGFGEEDLSDKPDFVLNAAGSFINGINTQEEADEFHRKQLRSLQAVDLAVGQIIDKLESIERMEETVLVFASDNGFLWGEHQLHGKARPYEESIRVPFVIAVPGIAPREDDALVAFNLDLGATVFDLVGIDSGTDGQSLMPLLENPDAQWRTNLLIENYGEGPGYLWAGLRVDNPSGKWKYVEHPGGAVELYDLVDDAYELENVADDAAYAPEVANFANLLASLTGPAITNGKVVTRAEIGDYFSFTLEAWGGSQPYQWTVVDGTLPEGLTLDGKNGTISGVPVGPAGTSRVQIQVQGATLATQSGEWQSFTTNFTLDVKGEPAGCSGFCITDSTWTYKNAATGWGFLDISGISPFPREYINIINGATADEVFTIRSKADGTFFTEARRGMFDYRAPCSTQGMVGNNGSNIVAVANAPEECVGLNNPPAFTRDPFTKLDVTVGDSYHQGISGKATDADGDVLVFSKDAGPDWLEITPAGAIKGTPAAGDEGLNSWTVMVDDGNGGTDTAEMRITVNK